MLRTAIGSNKALRDGVEGRLTGDRPIKLFRAASKLFDMRKLDEHFLALDYGTPVYMIDRQ